MMINNTNYQFLVLKDVPNISLSGKAKLHYKVDCKAVGIHTHVIILKKQLECLIFLHLFKNQIQILDKQQW